MDAAFRHRTKPVASTELLGIRIPPPRDVIRYTTTEPTKGRNL